MPRGVLIEAGARKVLEKSPAQEHPPRGPTWTQSAQMSLSIELGPARPAKRREKRGVFEVLAAAPSARELGQVFLRLVLLRWSEAQPGSSGETSVPLHGASPNQAKKAQL